MGRLERGGEAVSVRRGGRWGEKERERERKKSPHVDNRSAVGVNHVDKIGVIFRDSIFFGGDVEPRTGRIQSLKI